MTSGGPMAMDRSHRRRLAFDIAAQIQRCYGDRVLALGVYGSVARGTDGPYSDIEMHCVLNGTGFETAHEWSAGPWKAEVDVYSKDVLLGSASEVDVDWPVTHAAFTDVLAVYDPTGFFLLLRDVPFSQPNRAFGDAIRDVIVGELYERVGKVRNARANQDVSSLPYLAVELAKFGACLVGLDNRHLYASGYRFLDESLSLPGCPGGYRALCEMVMAGQLAVPSRICDLADAFWCGVEDWALRRGIPVQQELALLLEDRPNWERR